MLFITQYVKRIMVLEYAARKMVMLLIKKMNMKDIHLACKLMKSDVYNDSRKI